MNMSETMMTYHKMTNNKFVTCYRYFAQGLSHTLVYSVSEKFHMGKKREVETVVEFIVSMSMIINLLFP